LFNESASQWSELTVGLTETGTTFTSFTENYSKKLVAVGADLFELDDDV
jgi:hypothetical protein